jgi:hypothetical protein
LFWEGAAALVAALILSVIGVEADIVRAMILLGVVLGAGGMWGVIQAVRNKAE